MCLYFFVQKKKKNTTPIEEILSTTKLANIKRPWVCAWSQPYIIGRDTKEGSWLRGYLFCRLL